ncbi:MAG: rhomboid family intramembrane serine protease [Endomicrobia bacterium]|nr:rhomboid family intramembrane serine protease [Endomicrobiia bacterium]MCX7940314.1 rhomboid family intramembrane serine protease [Endomicrobiia bacterium]MDW8056469.1 rhomboid family intramembrane serine protease [Elusimicrobiota bacterium]
MIPLKDNIPSYRKPVINYFIIFLNTLVFIYQYFILSSRFEIEHFIHKFGFTPYMFLNEFPLSSYTILTSMFLHGGFMHFLGNMWFLYIFGDNVEDRYGHIKYFIVYILSGVAAVLLQFIINPLSVIPMIGASGAISGVLGSYFVFYPSAGVVTFIPFGLFSRIVVLPAVIFLGLWFIFQFLSGTQSLAIQAVLGRELGGVAYFAHIGGFLCGLITAILSKKRRRIKAYWRYL